MDVDRYIKKSKYKDILNRLRKLIVKTRPDLKEEFKMGVPWYGLFYIVSMKDHVNMGFCLKGLSKEDIEFLEGKGKTMRHLKFYSVSDIDEKKIIKLLKAVR